MKSSLIRDDVPVLLVTMKAAAAALSISRRTLEREIARGSFPAPVKIGRATRIAPVQIGKYLELLRKRADGDGKESTTQ